MIGVFDSGLGGLTVLKSLMTEWPNESFVYLGDTARLPYGTKSGETIRKYSEQNLRFLANQNVKALVVACNSASAHWSADQFEGLPVLTMIEPTSERALEISSGKRIGVLATRATVLAGAYEKMLTHLDPEVQVFSQPAPLLVPLAEEGLSEDPLTNLMVFRYVQPLKAQGVDTVILGCTHYPILRSAIQRALGQEVQLVESGQAVALKLQKFLKENSKGQVSGLKPEVKIFTTDSLGSFRSWAQEILTPFQVNQWDVTDL
jgi:glutamate racemase